MIHQLQQNIQTIQTTVQEACQASHRSYDEIHTICVSKTVPAEWIHMTYQLGQRHFAENRPNIFESKVIALKESCPEIQWHFIGNLQRRQVKNIINQIDFLHSLDRLSLAQEIQKRANHPILCFVQVNVSGEESKSGFSLDELDQAIEELISLDKIQLYGLMTMAPIDATEDELLTIFGQTCQILNDLQNKYPHAQIGNHLSMGMSRDFPQAIQQGADFIRVGTAFFQGIPMN